MKLLFAVYIFTGMVLGPFSHDMAKRGATAIDWAILAAIHIPAACLTGVGIWQAKKTGRFFNMDAALFFIFAVICYGIGAWLGFSMP